MHKANNPSGVAMKRINDILKRSKWQTGNHRRGRSRSRDGTRSQSHSRSRSGSQNRGHTRNGNHVAIVPKGWHHWSRGRDVRAIKESKGDLVDDFVRDYGLDHWVGEVIQRLSLYRRQLVVQKCSNMYGIHNPSAVVMSEIRKLVETEELVAIFIDINGLDQDTTDELLRLSIRDQAAVVAPGIFLQNVRNVNKAVFSRIKNIRQGHDAVGSRGRRW